MCKGFDFLKNLFGSHGTGITSAPGETSAAQESHTETVNITSGNTQTVETMDTEYRNKNFFVLLDNGHAKSTPGKRSPKLPNGERFYEWEFNRDVVSRIASGLDKLGIKYHILVPETDKDIALSERARRANEYCEKYGTKNCLFISVHSNALGNGDKWESAGKWSVWTTVGVTKSDAYAKVFYDVAEEKLRPFGFGCRDGKVQGNENLGPDYEENFTVIYKTRCPAILTENLFYTNRQECEFLMTDTGRQVIADIHIEGIKRVADAL
jgi:N-acetylmuramoyl-L-alanine amidase